MSSFTGNWCLIESDPAVFSELIRSFGCTGVQVEEVYSLEASMLEKLAPVHGLIFLFKLQTQEENASSSQEDTVVPETLYFAKQMIENACATQALINLLFNCYHPDVQIGKTLSEFKAFTAAFDPPSRGLCLTNSEEIRTVHNSFTCQSLFEIEEPKKAGDAYHFITYLPFGDAVFELDGLKDAPVKVGTTPEGHSWLEVVRPVIEKRIRSYSDDEIHFNLMAVISDRLAKYEKKRDELTAKETLTAREIAERARLEVLIADEKLKRKMHKKDNVRRRHNYVPLIVEFLKILAEEGKLVDKINQAKVRRASFRMRSEKKSSDRK